MGCVTDPGVAQALWAFTGQTREEHEDMPELQAYNRSLPSTLPVLATLVSLSLGLAAVKSARAHKAPAFEQVGTASWYGP